MKILAIGGTQLLSGFRAAGHRVCAVVKSADCSHPDDIGFDFYSDPEGCQPKIAAIIESFSPDWIFQGDHSGPLIHAGLEMVALPKIWYAVDAHLHGGWYRHYAPVFDTVFCAQQNHVRDLSAFHSDVRWLPLYCGRDVEPLPWSARDLGVSFVGKIDRRFNPARRRLFDELASSGHHVHIASGEWAPVYRRSKAVVNDAVHDDLNLRFFEAPGCGALLIADELTHSMSDILAPGEEYLTYRHADARSCGEQIQWVFAHEDGAADMAMRAFSKIHAAHLERHRAAVVLDRFAQLHPRARAEKSGGLYAHLAWAGDLIARVDLPELLAGFYKRLSIAYAGSARRSGDGSGYAGVLLAARAIERQSYDEAADLLTVQADEAGDEELEKRTLQLRLIAEIGAGRVQRARHLAQQAARRFGDDPEIAAAQCLLDGFDNMES